MSCAPPHAARFTTRGPVVDFNYVAPAQRPMHDRLENWARWARPSYGTGCHPMFRGYVAEQARRAAVDAGPEIDGKDASVMQRAIGFLPESHRHVINWAYIQRGRPRPICEKLGCTKDMLLRMLIDARQMLINRGVDS